jgi:hypothetical protein
MPGFDQTGPGGQGSMTGRRMGRCTNYGANVKKTEETPSINPNENSEGLGRRGQNRFRGGY